ncbi:MAG: hypothetical protein AB8F34_07370 [Akkermansiaceae bacterium]
MPNEDQDPKFDLESIIVWVGIIIAVWAGVAISFWLLFRDASGTAGDTFGGVNALFSGFALGAIAITLWLQNHQIKLQRKDIKMQREELKLQREEAVRAREEFENQTRIHDENLAILKKKQLEEEKRIKAEFEPKLMLRHAPELTGNGKFTLMLHNAGLPIYDLKIVSHSPDAHSNHNIICKLSSDTYLEQYKHTLVAFQYPITRPQGFDLCRKWDVKIEFKNTLGEKKLVVLQYVHR